MPIDPTEFRGPVGPRHTIAEFLRARLPAHLAACREAWGLDADDLPAPVSAPNDRRRDAYFAREIDEIDRWPLIAVTSGRRTQRAQFDYSPSGEPQARATYPIRVYSWVKAVGRDKTLDMRDNFASALFVTISAHTTFGTGGRLQIANTSGMDIEFSDVEPVTGDGWVAGSYVGFDVIAEETLTDRLARPETFSGDTVSGVKVTGHVIPVHPALQ
jgi:hypothetical protein